MGKRNLMGLLAMSMAVSSQGGSNIFKPGEYPKRDIKADREYLERNRPGMKEFTYKEGTIYALNKKNADRKAKNLGWI